MSATLLSNEVRKFKEWASRLPDRELCGEWECEYEEWGELRSAALMYLASTEQENWSDEAIANLLYAIARDNEIELLAQEVAENEGILLELSERALSSSESEAKWQLAVQLGDVTQNLQQAEKLLLKLVNDSDEYVSRRSLLSLCEIGSASAGMLAERAWNTGHEYQRIVALWVLAEVSSPKLPEYVAKAFEDGREYVVKRAREVQSST